MPGAEFSKKNKSLLTSLRDAFKNFMQSLPTDLFDDEEESDVEEAKSFAEKYELIANALREKIGQYAFIDSVYENYVVYSKEYNRSFTASPYVLSNNTVTFGNATPVFREVQYLLEDGSPYEPMIAMTESLTFPIELVEVAGKPIAKIISEGQGSSAYYPKEVLMRDGPNVFKAGTQMFLNHATVQEQMQRPEGDIKNLAAVTLEDARWLENGPDGPALYAPVLLFDEYKKTIVEKAPYTGLSINASGDAKVIDSKLTLTALNRGKSIDFVTQAGRGGKLILQEAAKNNTTEEVSMEELKELREAITKLSETVSKQSGTIVTMQDNQRKIVLQEQAKSFVKDMFQSSSLPALAIDRITHSALVNIPLNEGGEIDTAKLKDAVNELAMQEGNYLNSMGFSTGIQYAHSLTDGSHSQEQLEEAMQFVRSRLYG